MYDCQAYTWHNIVLPPASQKPDARSSFSFLPHDAGAVICGGYSRTKSTVIASKQTKGAGQSSRSVLKPLVHQDTWFLRITQPLSHAATGVPPTVRWERRKKPANPPNPSRAGATMVYHKGRGILFGGVHDVEDSEEGIDSEFFDTLFAWNIERNRYFQLSLRRARAVSKRQVSDRVAAKRGREKADENELLRNLVALETKGSIADTESMDVENEPDLIDGVAKLDKPFLMTMPHPRFNAQLAVQDDVLYIFGGTFELGDVEYTFDEMWAIDLGKLDGVQEVFHRELDNWKGSEDEESDSQSDEDGSDDEDEDEGEEPIGVPLPPTEIPGISEPELSVENNQPASMAVDTRPEPRPFESLRDFFTRTSTSWQEIALELLREGEQTEMSVKEFRKEAFRLSESKWWDVREEIMALEDEQDATGIGDVINIIERGSNAGGTGRRR